MYLKITYYKQDRLNNKKVINLLHYINKLQNKKKINASVDAEKHLAKFNACP